MATQKEALTRIGVASVALAAIALTAYFCRQTATPPPPPEATATARIVFTATPHETPNARPTPTRFVVTSATATEAGIDTGFSNENEDEIIIPVSNHPDMAMPGYCRAFNNRNILYVKGWVGQWTHALCLGWNEYFEMDLGGGIRDQVVDGPKEP